MTPTKSYRKNTPARQFSKRWFARKFGCEVHDYGVHEIKTTISSHLNGLNGLNRTILDGACGYGNSFLEKDVLGDVRTIGIDVDSTVRSKNKLHDEYIIQDLHKPLPFDDELSAVVSMFTWEHLENPAKVLGNFRRGLRDEGLVCIVAPQKYYYISLIEMLLPQAVKNHAWRVARSGRTHMPYPAFYQYCTRRSIHSLAQESDFDVVHFSTHTLAPIWFLRAPPLFMAACGYMACLNRFRFLEGMRSTFLIILKKKESSPHPTLTREATIDQEKCQHDLDCWC